MADRLSNEALVLKLLSDGREWYGIDLVNASEGQLKRGTVYLTLGRMEKDGYVASRTESRPIRLPDQDEPALIPRRLYKRTGKVLDDRKTTTPAGILLGPLGFLFAASIAVAVIFGPLLAHAEPIIPSPGCWDWRFSPPCDTGLPPWQVIGDVGPNPTEPIHIPIELPQQPDKPTTPYIPPTEPTFSTPEPGTLALLTGFVIGWLGATSARGRR